MIMVVLLHSNYWSLGAITKPDIIANSLLSFFRIFFEQLCLVGVNVFILISGWFGITPSVKGVFNILYQVFFFGIVILLLGIVMGLPIPVKELLYVFFGGAYYWFVPAYLGLYCFSPVLNHFVENSSSNVIRRVIVSFFLLEFIFGWITQTGRYMDGNSFISFIGLYLLARYVRLYSDCLIKLSPLVDFIFYLILSIVPSIINFLGMKYFSRELAPMYYSSPFVISAALFLLLCFSKLKISSKMINWIASSVFSIYLVHLHPMVSPYFKNLMVSEYNSLKGGEYFVFAILVTIVLGLICVMIDKIRLLSWSFLCKKSRFFYQSKGPESLE